MAESKEKRNIKWLESIARCVAAGKGRIEAPPVHYEDVEKLIAAVRLADKKAYESLQYMVEGQRGAVIARLDDLVARLRSGEVEEHVT